MQVQGVVISISLNKKVKKKDGGTYDGWELVYRTTEDEVRTIAKPVQGFKFNAPLKQALEELMVGDPFTATMEKNAGGFWDIKSVEKGYNVEAAPPPPPSAAKSPVATNSYQGRDYESKEERLAKQRYIIKQSSLNAAVAVLTVNPGKDKLQVEDVLSLADVFVDYVFDKKPLTQDQHGFENFEDDVPL